MESVASVLDREFPKSFSALPTMEDLAKLRQAIKSKLPVDASVELTTFMNTVSCVVYHDRKTTPRTAIVKATS